MAGDSEKKSQTIGGSATPSRADVAKTEQGKTQGNTLVLFRKLEIQLLDIRSLEPLPGEPVDGIYLSKLDGSDRTPVARYRAWEKEWEIDKHFPIYPSGTQYKHGLSAVTLGKASQMALDALGFDVGGPSTAYGDQGKTAFLRYRLARGLVEMKPEDLARLGLPDALKLKASDLEGVVGTDGKAIELRAPTDAEMKDPILKEYNTRCYLGAQFHLAALGFYPDGVDPLDDLYFDEKEGGEWTDGWKDAFKRWQSTKFGYPARSCWDWIKRSKEGKKLRESPKPFVTDDSGILHVPIPVGRIGEGFRVEVTFLDYPIVAEATKKEHDDAKPDAVRRDFDVVAPGKGAAEAKIPLARFSSRRIEWKGPLNKSSWDGSEQQANTNLDGDVGWRWHLRHKVGAKDRTRQLRTSWVFSVPACPWADGQTVPSWSAVHKKSSGLSMFFDAATGAGPHFVLFAMRWSQPAYDEFGDASVSSAGPSVTDSSYTWQSADTRDVNNHLHVVTQFYDMGGWDPFGGKGYGLFEHDHPGPTRWRGGDGHHGMDVHAAVGAPIFAVHGGRAKHSALGSSNAIGNITNLTWPTVNGARGKIGYGHLKDKVGASPRQVRAGEVIAVAGRTGNLAAVSDQAGHSHLNVGATRNDLRQTPDDANKCCIPFNDHTPLLFPCKCETTREGDKLRDCEFTNDDLGLGRGRVASVCWAVAELCCPHMPRAITAADLEGTGEASVKARRRVQAQLRKLGHYNSTLDGDFGGSIEETVKALLSDNIRASASGSATIVGSTTKNQTYTWINVSDDGSWVQIEIPEAARKDGHKDVTVGWAHKTVVERPKIGTSRMAIFTFKNVESLHSDADASADRFKLSTSDLARLDLRAPLVPIQTPAD